MRSISPLVILLVLSISHGVASAQNETKLPAQLGRWEGFLVISERQYLIQVEFSIEKGKVAGTFDLAGRRIRGLPLDQIQLGKASVKFKVQRPRQTWSFEGQVTGNSLGGKVTIGQGRGRFILERAPAKKIAKAVNILAKINKLPGVKSLSFQRLDPSPATIAVIGSEQQFLLGQCNQLVVLAYLSSKMSEGTGAIEGPNFRVDEAKISRQPGIIQQFPDGTQVTVGSAATLMVTMNDQSAFDLFVQRDRAALEQFLDSLGLTENISLKPFLSTREYYQLTEKANRKQGLRFLKSELKNRRAILQEIAKLELAQYRRPDTALEVSIGSKLSVKDLVMLVGTILKQAKTEKQASKSFALELLARSPQPRLASKNWAYYGFLSHTSEHTVIVNYVLQSNSGQWFCLSAAWTNPLEAVNIDVFNDYVQEYIESYKINHLQKK